MADAAHHRPQGEYQPFTAHPSLVLCTLHPIFYIFYTIREMSHLQVHRGAGPGLQDTPSLLLQCERYFLVVDNFSGLQIFNYDGRPISTPKFAGACTHYPHNLRA